MDKHIQLGRFWDADAERIRNADPEMPLAARRRVNSNFWRVVMDGIPPSACFLPAVYRRKGAATVKTSTFRAGQGMIPP